MRATGLLFIVSIAGEFDTVGTITEAMHCLFRRGLCSRLAPLSILLLLIMIIIQPSFVALTGPYLTVVSSTRGTICNSTVVQTSSLNAMTMAARTTAANKGTISCRTSDGATRTFTPLSIKIQSGLSNPEDCSGDLYLAMANNEEVSWRDPSGLHLLVRRDSILPLSAALVYAHSAFSLLVCKHVPAQPLLTSCMHSSQ
jgi:hypothetical protein